MRSADGGQTWSPVEAIDATATEGVTRVFGVALEASATTWVAAWSATLGDADSMGLRVARLGGIDAAWSAPIRIDPEGHSPAIASNGSGRWIVVYVSRYDPTGEYGAENDLFFVRSVDDGRTWSTPAPLDPSYAVGGGFSDHDPDIATNAHGNWLVVFENDARLLVARSEDDGIGFEIIGAVVDAFPTSFLYPQIATDAAGTWVAAFASESSHGSSAIGYSNLFSIASFDGGEEWGAPSLLDSSASFASVSDRVPSLDVDRSGRFHIVWQSAF